MSQHLHKFIYRRTKGNQSELPLQYSTRNVNIETKRQAPQGRALHLRESSSFPKFQLTLIPKGSF